MRNKSVLTIGALILALLVALPVFAANVRATFGNKDETLDKYTLEEKSDGVVYVRPSGGIRYPYEKATTNDTITAQETGKTFAVAPTTDTTFTLPDAEVGMEFTFVAVDGHGNTNKQIILNPDDSDTFRGIVNSAAATTFAAGDSTTSPGVTGDSLTIRCNEATYWDVIHKTGTWTDTN